MEQNVRQKASYKTTNLQVDKNENKHAWEGIKSVGREDVCFSWAWLLML